MSCLVFLAALLGFAALALMRSSSAITVLVSGGASLVASGIVLVLTLAKNQSGPAAAVYAVLVAEVVVLVIAPGTEQIVEDQTAKRRQIELEQLRGESKRQRSPEEE
jgi:mannitol-specific phosphotransferase system IIBC component